MLGDVQETLENSSPVSKTLVPQAATKEPTGREQRGNQSSVKVIHKTDTEIFTGVHTVYSHIKLILISLSDLIKHVISLLGGLNLTNSSKPPILNKINAKPAVEAVTHCRNTLLVVKI